VLLAQPAAEPGRTCAAHGARSADTHLDDGGGTAVSFDNRTTTDQLAALVPGDVVTFEVNEGFRDTAVQTGTEVKLTPTQLVVHYQGANDRTIEVRYRRQDGRRIGGSYGDWLIDPTHPRTVQVAEASARRRRQRRIDSLADRWARERENLDLLRRLQVAIGEYLDAEVA
jgi:hypothetical protein